MNVQRWLWALGRMLRRRRAEEDLDEELRAHLELEQASREAAGESPEVARVNARRDLGNAALVKEVTREMWGAAPLERLRQDARYAVRSLGKATGFTGLVITALALGIGSTTAIFTVVNSVILRPLPFPESHRLVTIWEKPPRSERPNVVSLYNFRAWQERAHSFEEMAAYQTSALNIIGGDEAVQISGASVTADFFRVLRVQPMLGRDFVPRQDSPAAPRLAMLSYGLWQRRFGGDPGIVGRKISIGGSHHEVIGVMPQGFAFPDPRVELYRSLRADYSGRDFYVVARLRAGMSMEAAQSEMSAIAAARAVEAPELNAGYGAMLIPLQEYVVGRMRPVLRALLGAVLFVLLIACANVANLCLMRAVARDRELSVRLALGAGKWRLAHQLMVESLLLSLAGGVGGVLIAVAGLRLFLRSLPADFPLPRAHEIAIDARVLTSVFVLCLVLGLLFGLMPTLFSSGRNAAARLRNGSRSVTAAQGRFRQAMVTVEVAVALVLVIGAGLMIVSFRRLASVDPGFRAEGLLTARMVLLPGKPEAQLDVVRSILEKIRALPQVRAASSISIPPMSGINSGTWFYRADRPEPAPAERPGGDISLVMPDYFRTMGIRLMAGRDFNERDAIGAPHVAILNASAARKFFGDEEPIGKRMKVSWNNAGVVEIVGVVSDIRHRNLHTEPAPCLFLPNTQLPFPLASLMVRTEGDPRALINPVKRAIRAVDRDQGVAVIETMQERVVRAGSLSEIQAWLVAGFSGIALLLATVGIYGVIAYTVSQRTREIGTRVALGANPGSIFGQMLGESLKPAALGIVSGLLASAALTRYLQTMLFEVDPIDPVVFCGVSLFMLVVAAAAASIPSRRAARVNPAVALREE